MNTGIRVGVVLPGNTLCKVFFANELAGWSVLSDHSIFSNALCGVGNRACALMVGEVGLRPSRADGIYFKRKVFQLVGQVNGIHVQCRFRRLVGGESCGVVGIGKV